MAKKYASLESLQTFKNNLDNAFASQSHKHTLDEITDFKVDSELSSTSTNPVQNKVLNAEFEAVSTAMNALEQSIDGKSDSSHTHSIDDVSNLQSNLDTINDTLSQKSQVQMITSDMSEVLSTLKIYKISQEQYDQELANGTLDNNAIYLTPDEEINLDGYVTIEQLNGKADIEHSHDDLYYTEAEIDTLLLDKSDTSHNHDDKYDAKGSADGALTSAKSYTDSVASGKANSSHSHDDVYYTETEIDTKLSGKANTSHSHSIADVTNLQSTLDAKATQTGLDTHANNTTLHTNSTERTNWNTAYTHSQAAHAPSDAEKNQNAFSNVTVGSTTISADSATDTLTIVAGDNITIIPDATNDKLTISAKDSEWDYVITTAEDFANISSYTGTVLVKGLGIDLGELFEEDIIVINASYIKFIGCIFYTTYYKDIVGNKNCTIDGFYWNAEYDSFSLSTFGKVINCKHSKDGDIAGYPLIISNCDYVHNCDFGEAYNCNHISDCTLTINTGSTVLTNCTHIHGLRLDRQYDDEEQNPHRECIFDGCSYMSNINVIDGTIPTLDIIYKDCLYVDADTCSGFLSDEDIGKTQVLTGDGSFETVQNTQVQFITWEADD